MLHADYTLILLVIDMFKDIPVIDFTRGWFISSGGITAMKGGDFAPCCVNVGNKISFGYLLVIEILVDLAGTAVDAPAY